MPLFIREAAGAGAPYRDREGEEDSLEAPYPEAGNPEVACREAHSPEAACPAAHSPEAASREAGSQVVGSLAVGSPAAHSPAAHSLAAGSLAAGSRRQRMGWQGGSPAAPCHRQAGARLRAACLVRAWPTGAEGGTRAAWHLGERSSRP